MSKEATIYAIFNQALQQQSVDATGLDTKMGILIGFVGLMLTVSLGFNSSRLCFSWPMILFWVGISALIASIGLLIWGYYVRLFKFPPHPRGVKKMYEEGKTEDEIVIQIASNIEDIFDKNSSIIVRKGMAINLSLFIMGSGLFLIALNRFLLQ